MARVRMVLVVALVMVMAGAAQAGTVTVDAGGGGDHLTIAAAIGAAVNGDTIKINTVGVHTENNISVAKSLTFLGNGADVTTVQAAATPGTANEEIFRIRGTRTVLFQDLTLKHGDGVRGGAIDIARWNTVDLTVERCAFVDNDATIAGAGIFQGDSDGGGSLTVIDSTFSGNDVADFGSSGGGAAIRTEGINNATIRNSTFSDNVGMYTGSWNYGGGVSITPDVAGLVENCTFVGNVIQKTGDAGNTQNGGGALAGVGRGITNVESCVFADNVAAGRGIVNLDVAYSTLYGTISNSLAEGDILNAWTVDGGGNTENAADAGLAPLAYNGGPTMTHMLLDGSLAIDTGSNPAGLSFDQRGDGFLRTYDAGTDMGAVEVQPAGAPIPEPASLGLLGLALLGLRRRRS